MTKPKLRSRSSKVKNSKVSANYKMDASIHEQLRTESFEKKVTMISIIEVALYEYFNKTRNKDIYTDTLDKPFDEDDLIENHLNDPSPEDLI